MKELYQYLSFSLGQLNFAIPVYNVIEVVLATAITPVSAQLTLIEGVFTYRGNLIPLLDIRARLNLPRRPLDAEQCFLVLHLDEKTLALRVDTVMDTVSISPQELAGGVQIPAISSAPLMIKLADEVLAICDLQGLLADEAASQYAQLSDAIKQELAK